MNAKLPKTLEALAVPVDSLKHYAANPRIGNVDVIAESLEVNGQYRPIVVNERTGEVLAGNHTLKAARKLGWTHIAATWVDADEQQAARIVTIDNRANDLAEYDPEALADLLSEMEDLTGTGYGKSDLDELLANLGPGGFGHKDKNAAPPLPDNPTTQRGEIIELGAHRVICGDATDPETIAVLMDGKRADIMWADPPYGIGYTGTDSKDRAAIENDQRDSIKFDEFLTMAFKVARDQALAPSVPIYICGPPGPRVETFLAAARVAGFDIRQLLVWAKNNSIMGHLDYHYIHELLLEGYNDGPGHRGRGGGMNWYGGNAKESVLHFDRPPRSDAHPTMKPVELVEYCLSNSSEKGMLVYDPFLGSGSTLVAATASGRVCYGAEIEPAYCDVVVDRYEKLTGSTVKRQVAA